MIGKGLSSLRMEWVVPKNEERAIEQLRRGSLSGEVERYMRGTTARIGAMAADRARELIGSSSLLGISPLSASLRKNPARHSRLLTPLYDTGEMYRGIRYEASGTTARLFVTGQHAHLAAIHEYGASFKVTSSTVNHFRQPKFVDTDAEAWARKHLGQVVDIPARPFLQPAIMWASERVFSDPRGRLAQGLFDLWTRSSILGTRRTETSQPYTIVNDDEFVEHPPRSTAYENHAPEAGASYTGGE